MRKLSVSSGTGTVMMSTAMTGCVKVIKIGQEAEYTGKTEFNADDDVAGIWNQRHSRILKAKQWTLQNFLQKQMEM